MLKAENLLTKIRLNLLVLGFEVGQTMICKREFFLFIFDRNSLTFVFYLIRGLENLQTFL